MISRGRRLRRVNWAGQSGQNRTKSAFGGGLMRKHVTIADLLRGGELYPRHEKQTKNPAETTGIRYKIEIMMSRIRKLKGLVTASLRVRTINDNP